MLLYAFLFHFYLTEPSTLLLFTHLGSITELLNKEQVIVEMMQALIGSMAILLTIPLTVLICGILYVKLSPADAQKQ